MSRLSIVPMTPGDWREVVRIYQEGIDTSEGTFEAAPPPTWDEFIARKIADCCLVARDSAAMAGWVVLSPFSHRRVYAGVAEVGIYIAASHRSRGVGSALLAAIIELSEAKGFWTLQAVTFPENLASVALHEKNGFKFVGRRERIAQMTVGPKAGQWRDTVLLERRSGTTGI
jgi:phosphinothricin acetyltransferase